MVLCSERIAISSSSNISQQTCSILRIEWMHSAQREVAHGAQSMVQQVLVWLGETLRRGGIVVERAPPIRPISNITPSMVAAKCHHYFFCTFCVTCARHETKSLFRFRFRFLAFLLRPFHWIVSDINGHRLSDSISLFLARYFDVMLSIRFSKTMPETHRVCFRKNISSHSRAPASKFFNLTPLLLVRVSFVDARDPRHTTTETRVNQLKTIENKLCESTNELHMITEHGMNCERQPAHGSRRRHNGERIARGKHGEDEEKEDHNVTLKLTWNSTNCLIRCVFPFLPFHSILRCVDAIVHDRIVER